MSEHYMKRWKFAVAVAALKRIGDKECSSAVYCKPAEGMACGACYANHALAKLGIPHKPYESQRGTKGCLYAKLTALFERRGASKDSSPLDAEIAKTFR